MGYRCPCCEKELTRPEWVYAMKKLHEFEQIAEDAMA